MVGVRILELALACVLMISVCVLLVKLLMSLCNVLRGLRSFVDWGLEIQRHSSPFVEVLLLTFLLTLFYVLALFWVTVVNWLVWTLWVALWDVTHLPYWLVRGSTWVLLASWECLTGLLTLVWTGTLRAAAVVCYLLVKHTAIVVGLCVALALVLLRDTIGRTLFSDIIAAPPKYWKTNRNHWISGLRLNDLYFSVPRRVHLSYYEAEYTAVSNLICYTWKIPFIPFYSTPQYRLYRHIKIESVERIENLAVWDRYSKQKNKMAKRLIHGVRPISSSKPVLTSDAGGLLSRDINGQINECYLFHGTKADNLHEISRDGLDHRFANAGLLGRGLYFAENPIKSHQYTDWFDSHLILLVRVLLGNAFINKSSSCASEYVRPPCIRCQKTRCHCSASAHYDSVIDDSSRPFREFVVYESSQCYPEYIIRYCRHS